MGVVPAGVHRALVFGAKAFGGGNVLLVFRLATEQPVDIHPKADRRSLAPFENGDTARIPAVEAL